MVNGKCKWWVVVVVVQKKKIHELLQEKVTTMKKVKTALSLTGTCD